MKKAVIILSIFTWILGGCKNQPKSKIKQEYNVCTSISEKYLDSVNDRFNDWEMETEYLVEFKSNYNFETFKTKVFRGKLAPLDFTNSELAPDKQENEFMSNYMKHYVDFWMENDEGINFGGHYTIISKSCGCMCQDIFVIDRISGKIFTDINLTTPENRDGKWGYLYKPDSKLLIANSELFMNFDSLNCYTSFWGITPELYVWTGEKFKRIQ